MVNFNLMNTVILACILITGCDSEENNSNVITNGKQIASDSGSEKSNTADKNETLFSEYSPLNDKSLIDMNHEKKIFSQVQNSNEIKGLWLFVNQGSFYATDKDTIGQIASKNISQLSIGEDGSLISNECGDESTQRDSLPLAIDIYTKTTTLALDNLIETVTIKIESNNSELSGSIKYTDITSGQLLAETDIRAYKISNSSSFENLSAGTLQLTSLTQPFNSDKSIDSQKDFTLHCMSYTEDLISYGVPAEQEKAAQYTLSEPSADLTLIGSNANGESIKMSITRRGMDHYLLGNYKTLYIETMAIVYTDINGNDITSMPSSRQEKDGSVTGRVQAEYTLGYRGLIGSFDMNHSTSGSVVGGYVYAEF